MSAEVTPRVASTPRRIMPVLFAGVFMAALDTAVIGPAIPALREAFGVDNRQVGLVMSVFILCSLCSTTVMASMSDRYGRRPVYLASVACFALGSLGIAISPSFWMVVASRAVQGIGAGGITPTASAVIGDLFVHEERGRALGLIGATYGMAFVLGPPLAGLLLVVANWRWIFLVNLPVAAVVLYQAVRVLPPARATGTPPPPDYAGIVTTFAVLSCFVLGVTRILDVLVNVTLWPWFLVATVVLLAQLIAVEKRSAQPMIPLSLFRNRRLAGTYLLSLGCGFAMGGVIFLTSIAALAYAVRSEHAGFVLLPLVVCSMLGSMISGRLLNRVGPRALLLTGFALLAAGYGATAITDFGLWLFLAASMPVGLGLGIVVGGALRSIAIDEAPVKLRATAQGLINIGNSVGTLGATAAISAIADFAGGTGGFAIAYVGVAVLMLMMLIVALRLGAASDTLVKALNP
ncbi:MAG: MFS transporter [Steroidobacterales bacterium]